MKLTKSDKKTGSYKHYRSLFMDGWYIEKEQYDTGEIVYSLVKDRINDKNEKYKSTIYHLAYDVAKMMENEFSTKIRERNKTVYALNFNPKDYVPQPGHKISFHE